MFYLSIYPRRSSLLVALVKKNSHRAEVVHVRSIERNVNPLYIFQPLSEGKEISLVSGLDTDEVFVRQLEMQLKTRREILSALSFQVEDLLPYPILETILKPMVQLRNDKPALVTVVACEKEQLSAHLSTLTKDKLDPDITSCVPSALWRFARHHYPKIDSVFVYHIGQDASSFVAIEEGQLVIAQKKNTGLIDLLDSPSEFNQELERITAYLQKKCPKVEYVLITGEEPRAIKEQYPLPPSLRALEPLDSTTLEFALPIGLALDAAIGDSRSIQFRPKDQPSERKRGKQKRQLHSFITVCCAFCLLTISMGGLLTKKRERAVLQAINMPRAQSLADAVKKLESRARKRFSTTIASAPSPRVSQVIEWLSNHSAMQEGVEISRFRYQLVNPPKLGQKEKTPAIKVEMQLEIADPAQARKVHSLLINDRNMIDRKKPVQWKCDHGIYNTSFTLLSEVPR